MRLDRGGGGGSLHCFQVVINTSVTFDMSPMFNDLYHLAGSSLSLKVFNKDMAADQSLFNKPRKHSVTLCLKSQQWKANHSDST